MSRVPVEVLADRVKRYDKKVGLRMLYREYHITSADERLKYNMVWDKFHKIITDAYGKGTEDAGDQRKAETLNGDSGTPTGEVVPEEQGCAQDVQETT